jgi:hypothetical protein
MGRLAPKLFALGEEPISRSGERGKREEQGQIAQIAIGFKQLKGYFY